MPAKRKSKVRLTPLRRKQIKRALFALSLALLILISSLTYGAYQVSQWFDRHQIIIQVPVQIVPRGYSDDKPVTSLVSEVHAAPTEPERQSGVEKQATKTSSNSKVGVASYYDYVLKSGWSSKGHSVCAARDWPRKTTLVVTNLSTGKSVECLVTDYGPDVKIHPDRIVDLSSYAFSQIASLSSGVVRVSVQEK